MDQVKIGRFIAELRKEQGLTQVQLGERLSVTNKTVSRWENGNYMPDLAVLPELAEYLGVSVNELIAGERFAEADYKRGADEQLLKTMRLIADVRSVKNSLWLTQGLGFVGESILALCLGRVFVGYGEEYYTSSVNPVANIIFAISTAFILISMFGLLKFNKGRALLRLGVILCIFCFVWYTNTGTCLALMVFGVSFVVLAMLGNRAYFKSIEKLLDNTPEE